MNKKQIVIIVTLLVLIVCAGILATRTNSMNSGLYVDTTNEGSGTKNAVSNSGQSSKNDFFTTEKLNRDKAYSTSINTLKTLIDDPNATSANKASAGEKYNALTTAQVSENKVESMLKAKGYEKCLCEITDGKATVTVKSKDQQINDKDAKAIQSIVMSVANINAGNIEIVPKQ